MINSKTDLTVLFPDKGSSLIEVLVAFIILSIGVLGIVGLQLVATKLNQTNQNFIQAALITNNLASRIQLNKNSIFNDLSLGVTSSYLSVNSYDFSSFSASCESSNYICYCQQPPSVIPICRSNSQGSLNLCDNQQLALFDTYEISCMLALISNQVKVVIYQNFNADDILLLDINVLWSNKGEVLTNNETQSSCDLAMQEVNGEHLCYSQQLVIVGVNNES